ncbi:hypothetical protein N0V90_009111 [Kalmusia sp. IMI 367209]|nr:hypothetical protein N0V90_009111 [Kalmusia sp. IMI 367209]
MATHSGSPRTRAVNPATPVHSPHHSVHSSTSSRLSLRNLTLHEYRKQQSSPASQATPPGKTLRRKPATSGLNEVERVPSISRTPLSAARAPLRPLHISQSLPPSPPPQQHETPQEQILRAQSAGPLWRDKPTDKVRHGAIPTPPPLASVTSKQSRQSPLRTTSFPSFDNSNHNDSQTTPSTFSLSRFPRPPNLADLSTSPINDENESPRLNTTSFASTAPATPPATPAVIHYRGASFDLVNPHNSLVLENIVTPSRDLESSEYLPLRSSEDPLEFSEMAPKRALYGDLSSAYASIIARRDEYPPPLNINLPLPPTPVAQSPGSSAFNSLLQSPESDVTGSPFSPRKPANESRFSLKQLTRSLTKKLVKTPELAHAEELRDLSDSRVSLASASFEGDFPRPLERSYRAVTPNEASFPDEPLTPVSPLDQAFHLMNQQGSTTSFEQSRYSAQQEISPPLTSMVPDDPSTQLRRASDPRPYASDGDFSSRPYYDDLASIYPSSSIYTNDDHRQSRHAPSYVSNRNSIPYWRMSGAANALADEYKSDALLEYPSSQRTSHHISRPLESDMFRRSVQNETEKTDTISRFIDQYEGAENFNPCRPLPNEIGEGTAAIRASSTEALDKMQTKRPESASTSPLSQFEFDFDQQDMNSNDEIAVLPMESRRIGKSTIAPHPGLPPSMPAPLAPAFKYDESSGPPKRPDASDMFSKDSSYGDTRQLLQYSQPAIGDDVPPQPAFQPSSSYSQPEGSSSLYAPQEALAQAEEIFANAASQPQDEGIPAMWSKRISSHLLRSKSNTDFDQQEEEQEQGELSELAGYEEEMDVADWETVGFASQHGNIRASLGESIANYSSSDGSHSSRDSMGFSKSFPVWEDSPLEPGTFQYSHPPPLRSHSNPFTSSPPRLSIGFSMPTMPHDGLIDPIPSSPPASTTVPAFYARSPDTYSSGLGQALTFTPWITPYAFSDKETQELLASGPNEDILYEADEGESGQYLSSDSQERSSSSPMQPMNIIIPTSTPMEGGNEHRDLPRENTFEKLTIVGPKANLTGTPGGTNMHEVGSSVADNSSPGAVLDPSPSGASTQSEYRAFRSAAASNANTRSGIPSFVAARGDSSVSHESPNFYGAPGRTGSVTRILPRLHTPPDSHERTPSQATLFPSPAQESPSPRQASRSSLRSPITPRGPRRSSRAAVPGQTKLKQMVLAPDAQTLSSSDRSVNDSRLFGTADSARPSTSNTHTPLRNHIGRVASRVILANEHSPHLLCPERAIDPEEEVARRKMSWIIFAFFCILPPTLILYRWMGDLVIVNVTGGRITHVSPKPKRIALGVGIAVNVGITTAILLPILIAHAAGSL